MTVEATATQQDLLSLLGSFEGAGCNLNARSAFSHGLDLTGLRWVSGHRRVSGRMEPRQVEVSHQDLQVALLFRPAQWCVLMWMGGGIRQRLRPVETIGGISCEQLKS